MRAIITLAVIILAVFLCSPPWWIICLAIVCFVAILVAARRYVAVASVIGWLGFEINHNNNLTLYILVGFIAINLLCGIFYGAGEPLFFSSWKEVKESSSKLYDESSQSKINGIVYGRSNTKTDAQLKRERDFLKTLKQEHPLAEQQTGETREEYNDKISNWSSHGIFVSTSTLKKYLANIGDHEASEASNNGAKTWFFWKMVLLFGLMSLIYLPFAFSDEVVRWLKTEKEKIEREIEEFNVNQSPVTVAETAGAATPAAGTTTTPPPPDSMLRRKTFTELLGIELSAEFIANLLGAAIRLLQKEFKGAQP